MSVWASTAKGCVCMRSSCTALAASNAQFPVQTLTEDSNKVQSAIGDKLGFFMQHCATFGVGYIIAFWRGWDMTLVMVGTLPFLATVGAILSKVRGFLSGFLSGFLRGFP